MVNLSYPCITHCNNLEFWNHTDRRTEPVDFTIGVILATVLPFLAILYVIAVLAMIFFLYRQAPNHLMIKVQPAVEDTDQSGSESETDPGETTEEEVMVEENEGEDKKEDKEDKTEAQQNSSRQSGSVKQLVKYSESEFQQVDLLSTKDSSRLQLIQQESNVYSEYTSEYTDSDSPSGSETSTSVARPETS